MFALVVTFGVLLSAVNISGYSSSQSNVLNLGEVLQVIDVTDGKFVLFQDNLKKILDKVPTDMDVGVVSIAGEYRKGKSFLMNFFLQYLQYRQNHSSTTLQGRRILSDNHPWLRDIQRNSGFQFKAGTTRDTTGINVWSEPFVIKKKDGKTMAVLVMDSQGLYDSQTTGNDNVRLFTMVSMLSSTLMLNTQGHINFDHFKQLEYFMKYAKSGTSFEKETKLFQTLTFLLRDFTLEESYGWTPGQVVLNQFLNVNRNQPREMQLITKKLRDAFSKINAFALPPPGNKVIRSDFSGELSDIHSKFLEQLESFVVSVVEDIEPRHPMLLNLNARTFGEHVKNLVKTLNDNLSPEQLIRLQENELTNTVNDQMNSLLTQHDDALRDVIDKKSTNYFQSVSNAEVEKEIRQTHERISSEIINKHKGDPKMQFYLKQGKDNKPMTAVETLELKMKERLSEILPGLLRIAELKRQEAILEAEKVELERKTHEEKQALLKQQHEEKQKEANRMNQEKLDELERKHKEQVEQLMKKHKEELERVNEEIEEVQETVTQERSGTFMDQVTKLVGIISSVVGLFGMIGRLG